MSEEEYYSIKEVSKRLKVAYLTVYRWVKTGDLHSFRAGKQYRISSEDMTNFIQNRQKK